MQNCPGISNLNTLEKSLVGFGQQGLKVSRSALSLKIPSAKYKEAKSQQIRLKARIAGICSSITNEEYRNCDFDYVCQENIHQDMFE